MADVESLKAALRERVKELPERGCFLCKWILGDLEKNGRLTNEYPEKSIDGSSLFPIVGKVAHLKLEEFWSDEFLPLSASVKN